MIEVENLKIVFGEGKSAVHALRGVSFAVAEGESFGLVGESGSGKSTVLRAIAGLNANWSGAMRVAGEVLGAKRRRAFYRQTQMVGQGGQRSARLEQHLQGRLHVQRNLSFEDHFPQQQVGLNN